VSQALPHAQHEDEGWDNENASANPEHAGQETGDQSYDRGNYDSSGQQGLARRRSSN
jgi:hypothetical protein